MPFLASLSSFSLPGILTCAGSQVNVISLFDNCGIFFFIVYTILFFIFSKRDGLDRRGESCADDRFFVIV